MSAKRCLVCSGTGLVEPHAPPAYEEQQLDPIFDMSGLHEVRRQRSLARIAAGDDEPVDISDCDLDEEER